MSDDVLKRLLHKQPPGSRPGPDDGNDRAVPPPQSPPIAPVWVGHCLRLAGEAYAPTLGLRLRTGKRVALANSYFSAARLEAGDQLEIDFVGHAISIRGRRLAAVFEAVAAQRALELAESPSDFDEDEKTPFIQTIAIVATQER
jgi:hypothetical protein